MTAGWWFVFLGVGMFSLGAGVACALRIVGNQSEEGHRP